MNLLLFNLNERLIAEADNITVCEHTEDANGNTVTIIGYGIPQAAEYCAFTDNDGDFQLFRIKTRMEDKISHAIQLYAENSYYELLTERPIIDVRPTNVTAGIAVSLALNGSRWQLGNVGVGNALSSVRWYYQHRISALTEIASAWGVRFKFRITISGTRISGRYVDLLSTEPVWRGKRYEIGKDILEAKYTIDKRSLVTAIIGRGKGEETGDGYGRRIGFADVVWSTANGDPVNKPAGQDYVEIPAATALYGVVGTRPLFTTKVYGDITDEAALLQAAYTDLLEASEPTVSASLTVYDLENMGFPHEAARYGDTVALIAEDVRYKTQIVSIKRDYASRGRDTVQLGAPKSSLYSQVAGMARELSITDTKAAAGAAIAQANASLLSGYIDTMVTHILSSGTNMYTDPIDGSLVLESADGTKAQRLTGEGTLIADSKTGDAWNWKTALSGAGIDASVITTGVLQASLIKILGSDVFYWDAANIFIKNPTDANQQIRIGCYDGTNYGIAFTMDGGTTWTQAITFEGVNATNLTAATGTFTGALTAATGTFLGTVTAGNWVFDNTGMKYTNGTNWIQMFMDGTTAYFKANGYAVEYGSDYTKDVTIKGLGVTLYSTGVGASVSVKRIIDGYTYEDACLVCDQAGSTSDTAGGNLGTSSKIWDIAWLRYIHYFTLKAESSRAVKKYIAPLRAMGRKLDALRVVSYQYRKDRTRQKRYGLVYEEAIDVLPEICIPKEFEQDTVGIDYVQLVPILLREIQDLRSRTLTLEKEMRTVRRKNNG